MLKKITIFFTLTALLLTFINAFAHEMSCEACLQCVGQSTVICCYCVGAGKCGVELDEPPDSNYTIECNCDGEAPVNTSRVCPLGIGDLEDCCWDLIEEDECELIGGGSDKK